MMINRMWRVNSLIKYRFSSAPAPLTDWEYISKIQNSIKHSNINEALRFLVNSHLDGQVLDMHIFRNFYLKIHETKAGITYQEIVYKLYREHFKPHILILDWMNSLARSNNPSIVKMLKQDYKMLKLDVPNVDKIKQEDQDSTIIKLNSAKKTEITAKPMPTTVTKHSINTNNKIIKIDEKIEQKQGNTKKIGHAHEFDMMGQKNLSQQNINKLLYSILGTKPKIILQNVEVVYNNYDQFDDANDHHDYQKQYDNDQRQQDQDQLDDFQFVKKIKVGKIQIITNTIDPLLPNEPGTTPKI